MGLEWNDANEQHLGLIQRKRDEMHKAGKDTEKLDEELSKLKNMKSGGSERARSFGTGAPSEERSDLQKQAHEYIRNFGRAQKEYDDAVRAANAEHAEAKRTRARMHAERMQRQAKEAKVGGALGGAVFAGAAAVDVESDLHRRESRNKYFYRTRDGKRQKVKNHWYAAANAGVTGVGGAALTHGMMRGSKPADVAAMVGGAATVAGAAGHGMHYNQAQNKKVRAANARSKAAQKRKKR